MGMIRGAVKSCVAKLKLIQPQPNIKPENVQISREDCSETLTETKNNQEFQSATWSDYKHHKHS